ncbi:MAG: hypothetical protein R8G34_10595 [Paracoccaceae bacterium]|nr:hypothetical protein [Paracoccaceae bacterium]
MRSELERRLQEYDGVAVSILSEAKTAYRSIPGYFEALLRLTGEPRQHTSEAASWLIKAEADDGTQFDIEFTDQLSQVLHDIHPWQAKLHILQSIESFELERAQAQRFFDWATSLADHPRPFLRAWSLHTRVVIGSQFADFRHKAKMALTAAGSDSAASVRARARKLSQQFSAGRGDNSLRD